jgi:anti-sigma regulatory factor (Ser/Thr protein kinase)
MTATAPTAHVQLLLCGPMDHLRLVWQTGETLLESIPFDEDPEGTRYNVLLALQEIVTNVLRHAYRGDDTRPVQLAFEIAADRFQVTIRDQGPPFDPLEIEVERAGEAFPEREGGFGILIARMVMDTMEYAREGDWNVLRMVKRVSVPALQRS